MRCLEDQTMDDGPFATNSPGRRSPSESDDPRPFTSSVSKGRSPLNSIEVFSPCEPPQPAQLTEEGFQGMVSRLYQVRPVSQRQEKSMSERSLSLSSAASPYALPLIRLPKPKRQSPRRTAVVHSGVTQHEITMLREIAQGSHNRTSHSQRLLKSCDLAADLGWMLAATADAPVTTLPTIELGSTGKVVLDSPRSLVVLLRDGITVEQFRRSEGLRQQTLEKYGNLCAATTLAEILEAMKEPSTDTTTSKDGNTAAQSSTASRLLRVFEKQQELASETAERLAAKQKQETAKREELRKIREQEQKLRVERGQKLAEKQIKAREVSKQLDVARSEEAAQYVEYEEKRSSYALKKRTAISAAQLAEKHETEEQRRAQVEKAKRKKLFQATQLTIESDERRRKVEQLLEHRRREVEEQSQAYEKMRQQIARRANTPSGTHPATADP